jgi:hypothetical protein
MLIPLETRMKGSSFFETWGSESAKKQKLENNGNKTVSAVLKRQVWELHLGRGVQEADCPLCKRNRIAQNKNSGFEAAHIIARKWFTEENMSIYYAYPSCSGCNNECRDMCLLDYLFVRHRLDELRRLIMAIFNLYVTEHVHEMAAEQRVAWKVLDRLYGPETWKCSGGIQNTKAIYELARAEQYQSLVNRAAEQTRALEETSKEMRALMESEIKPHVL